MELESYNDGTLLHIGIEQGQSVPVDGVIAVVGKEGEDFQALLSGGGQAAPAAASTPAAQPPAALVATPPAAPQPAPQAAAAPAATGNAGTSNTALQPDQGVPASKEGQQQAAAASQPAANVKASVIRMPKMSDTMTEGTIANWVKKIGDKVKSGDVLAEVETDKATMELESYDDGTLLYIGVEAGASVAVDGVIAIIGEEGADYKALLGGNANGGNAPAPPAQPAQMPKQPQQAGQPQQTAQPQTAASAAPTASPSPQLPTFNSSDERIKASPLAKKMAEEKGVDINAVKGTGENGRIVRKDVEGYTPPAPQPAAAPQPASTPTSRNPQPASVPGKESYDEFPVSQMRKVIARRLAESMYTAPHFYLTMEIDMTKAVAARASINEYTGTKISFNDMVIRASAAALRQHPKVNSSWLGDKIRVNHHIHIGVAVAVEEGLLVPVVRFADQKSLTQIAAEVKDLGGRAKSKQLQPADWEGNTFTISNLGMFGIDEFTAIINPPDACILAIGGIKEAPVVRDGEIKIASLMKVTLSCDHRVVDGAVGSAFLQTLKGLLEDPVRILA